MMNTNNSLIEEIKVLKKQRDAVVLGHFYQRGEIQDVADFIGDSLALAQWAAKSEAKVLVVCGVYFMAETAKILCPDKTVLIPDAAAGCSLADGCDPVKLKQFIDEHPGYKVISYVNTTAAVKALTDVVVTSSNAKQIVDSFSKDEKLLFGPDRNLGAYINKITGRNMLVWDAACEVHEQFTAQSIEKLKLQYPDAIVLAHPECKEEVLNLAHVVGSTAKLLKYAIQSDCQRFIVATEPGIIHQMEKMAQGKQFIPVPSADGTLDCIKCGSMQLGNLQKLADCLRNNTPEVIVDSEIAAKAIVPIQRMLDISARLGL